MRQVYRDGVPVAPDRLDQAVRGSHDLATTVDLLFDREVVRESVPVIGGQVMFDRRAATLARASVTFAMPDDVPVFGGVLSPFGY